MAAAAFRVLAVLGGVGDARDDEGAQQQQGEERDQTAHIHLHRHLRTQTVGRSTRASEWCTPGSQGAGRHGTSREAC